MPVPADAREPAAHGLSLTGRPLPVFADPVGDPIGTTPPRRADSVRRTMSLDVTWADGVGAPARYLGRCRDIRTGVASSDPTILGDARLEALVDDRQLLALRADPSPPRLADLIGVRAGGALRGALAEAMPGEKAAGTPLYLLLDDLAGATLVSRWAWSRWRDRVPEMPARHAGPSMAGVCIGFRPGSDALSPDGRPRADQNASPVVPLANPDDPAGWHPLPEPGGVHFRRARRIDLWRADGGIVVDSLFQDSATTPGAGGRWAIHEYRLEARIDGEGRIGSLIATPGTLPFAPCRAAPANIEVLVGTPAGALRETVSETLKRTAGCTHLNDTLRALAEIPVLAEHLPT